MRFAVYVQVGNRLILTRYCFARGLAAQVHTISGASTLHCYRYHADNGCALSVPAVVYLCVADPHLSRILELGHSKFHLGRYLLLRPSFRLSEIKG